MLLNGSPAQKRWLEIWKKEIPLSSLNIQLNHPIQSETIQENIKRVIQHNDVLRSVLSDETYKRFQILDHSNLAISCWKGTLKEHPDKVLGIWKKEGFDLKSDSFLKVALTESNETQYLLICCPSLVLDQTSILEFARMILGETKIKEEEIPHSEFSSWWNETLQERKEDEVTFWDEFIESSTRLNTHQWITNSRTIPSTYKVTNTIAGIVSQLHQVTGFSKESILFSAWTILISRWQEENKFIVGDLLDGRSLPELKNILGPISRLVPYQIDTDDFNSFDDVVMFFQALKEEAEEYQDYYIQDEKKQDFIPFQFHYNKVTGLSLGQVISLQSYLEPCFLKLVVNDFQEGIDIEIQYDGEKLSTNSAKKVAEHLEEILKAIAKNPNRAVKELQELDAFHFEKEKEYYNETFREQSIIDAWDEQVKSNPSNLALIDSENTLDYSEVNDEVDQLASQLEAKGIGIGDHVLLHMDKSAKAIIAILAIQKRKAAYLPVAMNIPQKRIDKIIRESNIAAIITFQDNNYRLTLQENKTASQAIENGLDSCAYIIYTSGSTGQPKGVQVSQKSVMDLVDSLKRTVYQEHNHPITIALLASLSFDASIQQIYSALLCGNTLVVISDKEKKNPKSIVDSFQKSKVSAFDCTPSLLSVLIHEPSYHQLKIDTILIGGEPLDNHLVDTLFSLENSKKTVLWNVYGLTECAVDSTYMKIDYGYSQSNISSFLPIGSELPNTEVLILDRFGNDTPSGILGELYIAGTGVAMGYLNDKKLDQERFLKPHSNSSKRYFKTGDYAWSTIEGNLQFLGRKDAQVKVRGFRIDLLEIKATFLKINQIDAAEVFINEEDRNLIIAVFQGSESLEVKKITATLSEELPEYMIPGRIVQVDSIPMNTNGKVDKKQLQLQLHRTLENTSENISTSVLKLINIFTNLLGRSISVDDDIFENGAHSLIVLQAIIKINEVFGQNIGFDKMYKHPKISDLAAYLEANAHQNSKRISPINTHRKEVNNIFLLPSILGTSSVFSNLSEEKEWNLWGLEYRAQQHENEKSIEELALSMHQEITSVDSSSKIILLGYSMGAYVAYEVAHLLKKQDKEVILILVDAHVNPNAKRYIEENDLGVQQIVLNNLKEELRELIEKYKPKEYESLPIYALEARDNKATSDMKKWSERSSIFSHQYIDGTHDDVFSSQHISSFIKAFQHVLKEILMAKTNEMNKV